jgi:hypothetical protein
VHDIFSYFDRVAFPFFLRGNLKSNDIIITNTIINMNEDDKIKYLSQLAEVMYVKTSALLTHISIMIASLVFMYSWPSIGSRVRLILLIEISAYLLLSIFCLRSIRLIHRSDSVRVLIEECAIRFSSYVFASNAAVIATLLLVITLLIDGMIPALDLGEPTKASVTVPARTTKVERSRRAPETPRSQTHP